MSDDIDSPSTSSYCPSFEELLRRISNLRRTQLTFGTFFLSFIAIAHVIVDRRKLLAIRANCPRVALWTCMLSVHLECTTKDHVTLLGLKQLALWLGLSGLLRILTRSVDSGPNRLKTVNFVLSITNNAVDCFEGVCMHIHRIIFSDKSFELVPHHEKKWCKLFLEYILGNAHCASKKCAAHGDDMVWYVPMQQINQDFYIGQVCL